MELAGGILCFMGIVLHSMKRRFQDMEYLLTILSQRK